MLHHSYAYYFVFYMPLAYHIQSLTIQCFQQHSTAAKIVVSTKHNRKDISFFFKKKGCYSQCFLPTPDPTLPPSALCPSIITTNNPLIFSPTPRLLPRPLTLPRGHNRRDLLHHPPPLFSPPFLPLAPPLLGDVAVAVAVVVHFYLLPDGDGAVREQWRVETAQLGGGAVVDDGDGGRVFFAQARDRVDVVPVCGCGWAGW